MTTPTQKIFKVRRQYNQWVVNQTLEDYALRYTSRRNRAMSIERVAKTALGATAFLALEGIAAAVTLSYGFINTVAAMLVVCLLFFITGFPIAYYSAKHGLDIDLLTRGAGFGYLGSTITSLIYASFTFIFFAIEAVILASALKAVFGIPLAAGYFLCSVAVIPIVTHGISAISRFQLGTQTLWVILQCAALAAVIYFDYQHITGWSQFTPNHLPQGNKFDLLLFGAAASVFFAMVAQIGEQVDYLRFMPTKTRANRTRWWFWLILAGPGWVIIGVIKMLLGSLLAYIAIGEGIASSEAADPMQMYQRVYFYLTNSETLSLLLAGTLVIISQMKINVTNAYAGSIAWSNFFSRLTHSHPGRVVWLIFNVSIALLLMELGIFKALEAVLSVFALVAVGWLGSLSADLLINKPLGLSPPYVEFKRAHLYDINPVGTGSMIIATSIGMASYLGWFGEAAKYLCHFTTLGSCFILVPGIAWLTGGRFYLARQSPEIDQLIASTPATHNRTKVGTLTCGICEHEFEVEDISYCSAYAQPICSLCCSLDARCMDSCKPKARISQQLLDFLQLFLPKKIVRLLDSRLGKFLGIVLIVNLLSAVFLSVVARQFHPSTTAEAELLNGLLWIFFFLVLIISGIVCWLFLLAHESRLVAQKESNRQTRKLMNEITAHQKTDLELQRAKEQAEKANAAKSRYLTGISHELRTPLQSIIGYAQLLHGKQDMPAQHKNGLAIIQRSGQYLTDLIEGLLDISKIEAGRLELYRNRTLLPELLNQLADMFQMQANAKGVGFHFQVLSKLPSEVVTDEKHLRQILINLLSNAVKYTSSGQVNFTISYRSQVAEFTVQDTGPGIPQEYLGRIFNPFERVRNTQTPNLPGTGLGLTIVKLLTEIMGGEIQVASEPGLGSTFTIHMMLPSATSASEPQIQRHISGYEGARRRLLVVDDDPVVRGLLADLLTPLGFIILEAHDAPSCLKLVQQGPLPDLCILDINMPGISGLQLAHQLRNCYSQLPLLMLSADAQEQNRQTQDQAVYNDYLVKPISNQKLLDTLALHLALTWVYQADSRPLPNEDLRQVALPEPKAPLPKHSLIDELKAFAELGYKKGVTETLTEIDKQALLDKPVLNHLQQLNLLFQFEQICNFLETTK